MLVGDFVCRDGGADGIADPRLLDARQAGAHRVRARGRRAAAHVLQRLLRHQVPVRQARHHRRARLRRRRDGERRRDHLPRAAAAGRSRARVGRPAQERRRGHLPRDRAPVVRQPGDDEVVGRHLAERGLRHLDGEQAAGRVEARVARGPRRGGGHAERARPRRAAVDAGDPHAGRDARRDQRGLRRDRLREDRGRAAHDRGVRRRRAVPQGRSVVPEEVRLRQRRRRGLLDRDDARDRAARRSHHEELRRAAGRAGALGARQLQSRQPPRSR